MSSSDINLFFSIQTQIKLFHWQTRSYAKHKATDETLQVLDDLIDKYVEVYSGKYGKSKLLGDKAIIHLKNLSESSIILNVKKYIQSIQLMRIKETDTDLLNIRDEILASLNKLLYLFTLH